VQQLVAAVTGLPGNLVRPAFQSEPPGIVDNATAWAAVQCMTRPGDTFPQITYDGANSVLHRHEQIDVLASFYDLGTNGQADYYAALLRDGLAIPVNTEILTLNGMGLISCGDLTAVPTLLKQLWNYRVDCPFSLRREAIRSYATPSIQKIIFNINGDGLTYDGLRT
jgi:hypothetical protein